MSINSDTLKALRKQRQLSQEDLAGKAEVAKRTIARLESNAPPKTVRQQTIASLAAALDVPAEALGGPIDEVRDKDLEKMGFTRIKVLLSEDVRLNYKCVTHHYDVNASDLIDAAPWMFTLIAEMSLAKRNRQLKEADDAFEEAMRLLPSHLAHGYAASTDFQDYAVSDEEDSLAKRDIFGKVLLDQERLTCEAFNPDESNPFVDFLLDLANEIESDAIKPVGLKYSGLRLPEWQVFQSWLHELTGGNEWAEFAIRNVEVRITEMPEEMKGPDKLAERVAWLVKKIPPEVREREEKRQEERRGRIKL